MKKHVAVLLFFSVIIVALNGQQQKTDKNALPVKWEELTAPDFIKAVEQSAKVCIIPLGILEKHGPHMPLGTDLIAVRAQVLEAVKNEYAVVFPEYFVGQINEARHQPGTVAYSSDLVWKMLQETCDEIARNGFEKIILVNGHGGNNNLLPYFCMSLLSQKRNYQVYLFQPKTDSAEHRNVETLMKKLPPDAGGHAGTTETSLMMVIRPDLLRMDNVATQSGEDLKRLSSLPDSYTGIWWYAQYPNHYSGNARYATPELGKALMDEHVKQLIRMIREVKADTKVKELQEQFYRDAENPLKTKQ